MTKNSVRVYADTSVYGGTCDEEYSKSSNAFMDLVRQGRYQLVLSSLVAQELLDAPVEVKRIFSELLPITLRVRITEKALSLLRAYLEAEVVTEKWRADALHVAIATVEGCQAIVSWNFRHIVHFQKIPLYNAVNVEKAYGEIAIHTPQEMLDYED